MNGLPLTLHASPYETPAAFASRLANRNQCNSLYEFAVDQGLNLRGLEQGDEVTIKHLRELASLPDSAFDNTTSYGHKLRAIRVGREEYRSSTFSSGEIRFCPRCIAEDVQAGGSVWHAIHRLHWQIRFIAHCIDHQCPLEIANVNWSLSGTLDPTRAFAVHLAQFGCKDVKERTEVKDFETYLSLRAYGNQTPCWADQLEVFSLLKASTALGVLIERGPDARAVNLDDHDTARFAEMGFQIIKGGPVAMRDCWERIRLSPEFCDARGRYQPQPRFGAFQRLLGSDLQYKAGFEPVRGVFRDYLTSKFPFADGADVLGEKLVGRRLYSLLSAQRSIGKRKSTFHEKLVSEGFATVDGNGHVDLTKPLTVGDVERFLHEINALLFERDVAVFVGITVESFRLLANADLVPASLVAQKSKHRAFEKSQLELFRDQLMAGLAPIQTVSRDQTLIGKAPVRLNCDLKALVAVILAGRLEPAGLWRGTARLDHIVINLDAAKAALPDLSRPAGMQRIPAFRLLRFNNATLNHLIEHGLLTSFQARHPISRLMTQFICTKSMQRFNQSYVSLGILAEHDGAVGGPQYANLRKAGMKPTIDKLGLSKIYQRSNLSLPYAEVGLNLEI